jgi:hypothetical protein
MSPYHQHRRYHLHGLRVLFLGIALISLCLVKIDTPTIALKTSQVLAYATNISRADLLTYTNQSRAQNGLGALALNSQLNTSSQNKAQDMITYDYWAHTSPSGVEPWYWFDAAGYVYSGAGENLAYGFDSSSGTVNGWMNSPSHRANMLGDYVDVGFGIANGANYQGGPNTVVVAHYGKPQASQPAPEPTPPPAAPTAPASTPTPPQPTAPAQAPEATPAPAPTPTPAESAEDATPAPASTTETKPTISPVVTTPAKNINLLESVQTGTAPAYGVVSLILLVASSLGFFFTHRALLQHALVTSEVYVMKHPMVDIAAVGAISMLALSTSVGHI